MLGLLGYNIVCYDKNVATALLGWMTIILGYYDI